MRGHVTLWCRSDPSTFGAIRKLIVQVVVLCGGSSEDALELEVATGEVLANTHQHAYQRSHGPLEVDVAYDDQKIEISIHDEGDVTNDVPTMSSILAETRGRRGLYLVGKMTDYAEIVHPRNARGGTTVRMIKYIDTIGRLERMLQIDADLGGPVRG